MIKFLNILACIFFSIALVAECMMFGNTGDFVCILRIVAIVLAILSLIFHGSVFKEELVIVISSLIWIGTCIYLGEILNTLVWSMVLFWGVALMKSTKK